MPLDEIRDHLGEIRRLGRLPTPKGMLSARGATNIGDWRMANGFTTRTIPRSEWRPLSMIAGTPNSLREDQGNYGSCSCATITGAANLQRYNRGQKYEPLSWAYLYDQVNGGRDAGSNMGEASGVARTQGIPPMSSYPKCLFRSGRNPTGVPWYKEADAEVTFSNFDEYVTGILMGCLVQHCIDANSLNSFDGDGVARSVGRSPNHSIYSAAVAQVSGKWVLRLVNSWTAGWGPFGDGTCYVTEAQCNAVADTDDGQGHMVPLTADNAVGIPSPS